MKKLAALVFVLSLSFSPMAHATYTPTVPVSAGSTVLPNFWLFAGAIGFAAFVEYMDAEGIENPLCDLARKCYQEYPEPVHRDGV